MNSDARAKIAGADYAESSAIKTDILKCVGLFSLLFGVLLLDRCFAAWRVDPRSFPDQNGQYAPQDTPVTVRRLNKLGTRKIVTATGAGLLVLSVFIFSRAGEPKNSSHC